MEESSLQVPPLTRPLTRVSVRDGAATVTDALVRLQPGRLVPGTRYRIQRWLGEGGMGVVYEVRHADIERRAALKVLRVDRRIDPDLAQRFRDEARAASRIGADNIVEIYDFGELPDGRLTLTMEFLDGHSLVEEIERHPMAPERLLPILRQACKGLAAAHDAGIIHRDVKPENIILSRRKDGRPDLVKIVDFGIARIVSGSESAAEETAGSPHYMAPEVCQGLTYDGRVDLYALGCTAYELMCGQPPFMRETVEEVLKAHITDAPRRLADVSGVRYPEPLEEIVLRCLEKDPARRYASLHELEAALCEAQVTLRLATAWDDLPIPAVDEERRQRLRVAMRDPTQTVALQRRRRRLSVAAASLAVALPVLATGVYWSSRSEDPAAAPSMLVETLARDARDAASVARYVYPTPSAPTASTAYRRIIQLENLAPDEHPEARARAAALRSEFAEALEALGDRYWSRPEGRPFATEYYAMALLFDEARPRARERVVMTPVQLATLRRRAELGEFAPGELEAVALLAPLAGSDEAEILAALEAGEAGEGSLHGSAIARRFLQTNPNRRPRPTTRTLAATPPADTANDAADAAPVAPPAEVRDPAAATRLVEEGRAALRAGRLAEAEVRFHRALARDSRSAAAYMGLSDVSFERGAYQRAVPHAEKAVQLAPRNRDYRLRLGDGYFKILRYADARRQYTEAASLGHPAATARLEKVKERIGG